jgi:hypothetical protein
MAEATASIQQSTTIRITTAAHVLAQLRARQAVKDQLRKRGEKVAHYSARDISVMARDYLLAHRSELMPDAIETITRWTLAGEFGKRAQRELCAKLTSDAQKTEAQKSITSTVQMSGAK